MIDEEEKRQIVFNAKYARIIECMSEMYSITLDQATDIFYNSVTATLIDEGVADLHCRSDKYLATEIWNEYKEGLKE